jgi:tetratricopeptide (TPR) repeat protein
MGRLPRRRRYLAITAGLGGLFIVVAALLLWVNASDDDQHRPGEAVEGLTSELARHVPEDAPRLLFADVTADAGIDFQHFAGVRSSQLPEDMGSGAAWGDYDNDGWLDLYVVNEPGPLTRSPEELAASPARAALYHNEGDGTFTEVAADAGVDFRGFGMAAAWGDYDNDGWADLFVSAYGENALYRNNGDGTFEDRTEAAGMAGLVGYWSGAAWSDYDLDGSLDLYVGGYVRYSPGAGAQALQYDVEVPASLNPSSFHPERNLLFHNNGDGTFVEVAEEAGVSGRDGRSLTVAWADFDDDGWPDLYVANDVSDNALYRNLGDGTFQNVSLGALVADYRGAMGLAIGDWDGDGDTDLFVTHWIAQENALYNSLHTRLMAADPPPVDPLRFMDEAERYGLGQIALDYIGWGTSFIDFDNDGWLDLLVVNGSTLQMSEQPELLEPMPDQVFWHRSREDGFYDVSSISGEYFQREYVGRGAAFADYDADGDVDVFIVNNGGPGFLLRNDGQEGNGWLEVRLEGRRTNRSAIGAKLKLHAEGAVQTREVGAQSSYLSQNSPFMHFGLGVVAQVDSIEIRWPGGERQVLQGIPANRVVRVVEGEAAVIQRSLADRSEALGVRPAQGAATPGSGRTGGTEEERAAVLRFWELFREATRLRIQGHLREAETAYTRALEIRPDHWDALYYRGNLLFEFGDFEGARRDWERLVRVSPASPRGHIQLGRLHACFERGTHDLAEAEARFLRARELNQEETGPLLWLARTALIGGDRAGAREYLEDVLGMNATNAEAHFLSSYLAWKEGAAGEASDHFASAVQHANPTQATDPELGEGETRSGRAMLTVSTRCRAVQALVETHTDAGTAGDEDLPARMVRAYRALEALLETARNDGV